MARVTYTPIPIGTSSSSGVNSIFSAIATQTTNLDEDNWAEEGLDYRVFEANIASEQTFTPIEHTATATQAVSATWATLDPGAAKSFRSAGFTTSANEVVRLVFRGELLSDGTNDGAASGAKIEIRLRYSIASSATTLTTTVRRYAALPTTISGFEARMDTMVLLDLGAQTFDWVEVQIRDANGSTTVQVGRATLIGTTFKRVT